MLRVKLRYKLPGIWFGFYLIFIPSPSMPTDTRILFWFWWVGGWLNDDSPHWGRRRDDEWMVGMCGDRATTTPRPICKKTQTIRESKRWISNQTQKTDSYFGLMLGFSFPPSHTPCCCSDSVDNNVGTGICINWGVFAFSDPIRVIADNTYQIIIWTTDFE